MSHFADLDKSVIGIVLVGAEGCSETSDVPWIRDATEEEKSQFKEYCHQLYREAQGVNSNKSFNFGRFLVDGNGRPYWIKAILDHPSTPSITREKAAKFTRVVRIGSD